MSSLPFSFFFEKKFNGDINWAWITSALFAEYNMMGKLNFVVDVQHLKNENKSKFYSKSHRNYVDMVSFILIFIIEEIKKICLLQ